MCCTVNMLPPDQVMQLKETGLTADTYNHLFYGSSTPASAHKLGERAKNL